MDDSCRKVIAFPFHYIPITTIHGTFTFIEVIILFSKRRSQRHNPKIITRERIEIVTGNGEPFFLKGQHKASLNIKVVFFYKHALRGQPKPNPFSR